MNGNKTTLDSSSLKELLKSLRTGGVSLVENDSFVGMEIALYTILTYARVKGLKVTVEDMFDTFPVYMKHLEIMGLNVKLDDVNIIKVGGTRKLGNTILRIDPNEDPGVYVRKLERALRDGGRHLYLNVGLERYLAFQGSFNSVYPLIQAVTSNLGANERFNIYVVDIPVLRDLEIDPLPLLEEMATSVLLLEGGGDYMRVKLKKSYLTLRYGVDEATVSPTEVVSWVSELGGG